MKLKAPVVIMLAVVICAAALICAFRLMARAGMGSEAAQLLNVPYPAVIAHRGASYLAPEETAPAYKLARDMGADYLELDVQRTRDGALIALHDDTMERTTDVGKRFPGRAKEGVRAFTLREIKALDAGSWFNAAYPERARGEYAGVRVLTLDEVVDVAEGGREKPGLYIESKNPALFPGIEDEIVNLLRRRGWIGPAGGDGKAANDPRRRSGMGKKTGFARVIFQSFELESLLNFKQAAPDVPRVYLVSEEMEKTSGWDTIVQRAREAGSGLGPVGYLGLPWKIGAAHRNGLIVHLYTINVGWQYRLFSFFGADGFFTDRCDQLLKFYGRPAQAPVH